GHEVPRRLLLLFRLGQETAQEAAPRRRRPLLRDRRLTRGRAVLVGDSALPPPRVSAGTVLPGNGGLTPMFRHNSFDPLGHGAGRMGGVEKDQHLAGQRLGRDGVNPRFVCQPSLDRALERRRMVKALDLIPRPSRDGDMHYLNHGTSFLLTCPSAEKEKPGSERISLASSDMRENYCRPSP